MFRVDIDGSGQEVGTITLSQTPDGLQLTPNLRGLPPGDHGFHVHENASCASEIANGRRVAAGAAGPHYDPNHRHAHKGPFAMNGHKGDLPVLVVASDGTATTPVIAPSLNISEIKQRSLVVHVDGDNYDDHPLPLGGGGARLACGIAK